MKEFSEITDRWTAARKLKKARCERSIIWKLTYLGDDLYNKMYYWLFNYDLLDIIRGIKWFFQRGFRGYSDRDLWNFDAYIARMISRAATELRRTGTGVPWKFCQDNDVIEGQKKFNLMLEQVAWAFKVFADVIEKDCYLYDLNMSPEANARSANRTREIYADHGDLKDYVYVDKESVLKMKEGLQLFIDNFECFND